MRYLIHIIVALFACNALASTAYDRIYLVVNDHIITQNEIDIRLFEFLRQKNKAQLSEEETRELRNRLIKLLIEEALLDIRADELKIVLTDEQLDAEVDHYRKQNSLSQIEFEDLLERRNITLNGFKDSYLKRTQRTMVINQEVRSQIEISDESLKTLHDAGAGKSVHVRARHLLLLLRKDAPEKEELKVKQKIIWIKKQIQSGKSFTEMVDLYSQDPSAKSNHGDLGFFGKKDMVREFAEAAFSMDPGTLSNPVRSPFGYHLIEVMEKKDAPQASFEKAKQKLYQQEYQKVFKIRYQAYIQNLKQKARIIRR